VDGSNGLMRFFSVVRSRAGMAAMFANVSNTVQQITGFSLAALKVKPSHLMGAAVDFVRDRQGRWRRQWPMPRRTWPTGWNNEVEAMTDAINDILLNPNVYERAVAGRRSTRISCSRRWTTSWARSSGTAPTTRRWRRRRPT
jgi:hypothetical protein